MTVRTLNVVIGTKKGEHSLSSQLVVTCFFTSKAMIPVINKKINATVKNTPVALKPYIQINKYTAHIICNKNEMQTIMHLVM